MPTEPSPALPEDDADDEPLEGVEAIAAHIGQPRRRTQHMIDTGVLPTYREGRLLRMRPSTYREFDRRRQDAALERALRNTEATA
jgi:hypothetical protein